MASEVTAALASGQTKALIVCSQVGLSADHTTAGLISELDQLEAVQQAVQLAQQDFLFVYLSVPQGQGIIRRRMQSPAANSNVTGFGNYTVCGILCQVYVAPLLLCLAHLCCLLGRPPTPDCLHRRLK